MLSNYGYEDGSGSYYITIDTDKCCECEDKPCLDACPHEILQMELDDYDEVDGMANSDIIKAAADKYLEPTDPPIMVRALEIIINEQQVSTSYLQRRLGIGYNKAADIIDKLEQRHVISAPLPGGQKRSILITDGLETPND